MSKTVRISDELYQSIDEARSDGQTFEEFIEAMAKEYGLLPEGIRDVAALRKKLENVYGFEGPEVDNIVSALRAVYAGEEKSSTIGYPHSEAEDRYGRDNIGILKQLGLVKEHHYTGKYDFGYETTGIGETVAAEAVNEFLEDNREEIKDVLSAYDDRMLSFLIEFGFEQTDTGHLTTRSASLTLPPQTAPEFDNDEIQRHYDQLKRDLVDLGIAERHSEQSMTVLPPEFADFVSGMGDDIRDIHQHIEILKVIYDYVNGDLETREEILTKLDATSEPRLQEVINEFHEEGLTSRYVQKDIPFLVKDQEALIDRLHQQITEELSGLEA